MSKVIAAEFVGYEHTLELLGRLAEDPMAIFDFMPERSAVSYRASRKHFEYIGGRLVRGGGPTRYPVRLQRLSAP